uniref:Uncharacterized protein n=1 Tax=Panagrolaimus davidi TaxID=227884 RepID=A0A914QX82_9BILA
MSCFFGACQKTDHETNPRIPESTVSTNCSTESDKNSFISMFEKPFLGSLNQAQVILARGAGIFYPSVNDFKDKCVCQNHFEELLSKWNSRDFKHIIWRHNNDRTRKTACSFPEGYGVNHGTQRPFSERVVTYEESEAFLKEFNFLIHVDLPICRKHKDYINQYVKNKENITKSDSLSSVKLGTKMVWNM